MKNIILFLTMISRWKWFPVKKLDSIKTYQKRILSLYQIEMKDSNWNGNRYKKHPKPLFPSQVILASILAWYHFKVYPTNINLQRGIHRGLVKWSEKPKLIDTSISQSVRETPAFKKLPSKPSLQHSMMDQDQVNFSVLSM